MEPIRILYVHGGILGFGGTEAHMMAYYRHFDHTKLQVDFVVHGFEKGVYDDEIEALGGKIYHVPVKSQDYFGNIKALQEIFGSGQYPIVHSHMDAMNAVVLKQAKKCEVPVRISHSHNTQHLTQNRLKILLNNHEKKQIEKYATDFFACSDLAGKWLYGSHPFVAMKNAIDTEKYHFDSLKREKVRENLGIGDRFTVGHIGRLHFQKNHDFLLKIFRDIHQKQPESVLLLVGDGERRAEIEAQIDSMGLQDSVILTGNRSDVPDLLQAMDVFCFPSLFEGLGIVLAEAQAAGLRCVASDVIPAEAAFTDNVTFMGLNESSAAWADAVLKDKEYIRKDCVEETIAAGYDIRSQAEKLQEFYLRKAEEVSR